MSTQNEFETCQPTVVSSSLPVTTDMGCNFKCNLCPPNGVNYYRFFWEDSQPIWKDIPDKTSNKC
jgi:hypothetical protein